MLTETDGGRYGTSKALQTYASVSAKRERVVLLRSFKGRVSGGRLRGKGVTVAVSLREDNLVREDFFKAGSAFQDSPKNVLKGLFEGL